jgi:hypothetical protein
VKVCNLCQGSLGTAFRLSDAVKLLQGQRFLPLPPHLRSTQSHALVVQVLSRGVKQPGHDADHSPPCSAKVKNVLYMFVLYGQGYKRKGYGGSGSTRVL